MDGAIVVLGCKGCGNVVAEACLTLAGIPFRYEEVDYDKPGPGRDRLLAANPLGQVPTLLMPDGSVMTETLAIAHLIDALHPGVGLIPREARFLRWSTFLVTAVYPTFTYGDSPEKWVADAAAARSLRQSTDEHRKKLMRLLEGECGAPYFLGPAFSLLDLYLFVMTHWRPRQEWYAAECPKITAVAARVAEHPALMPLWRRHFG